MALSIACFAAGHSVFFSELFQITAPIRRTAARITGHEFIGAMPEIDHDFEQPGTVFPYDQTGSPARTTSLGSC